MLTDTQIEEISKKYIESIESLGEKTGGSGHKGYKSLEIDSIKHETIISADKSIKYQIYVDYRIIIETEFTYYPDNPPYEYSKSVTFYTNEIGEITIVQ